jgi:hypothetical protein
LAEQFVEADVGADEGSRVVELFGYRRIREESAQVLKIEVVSRPRCNLDDGALDGASSHQDLFNWQLRGL